MSAGLLKSLDESPFTARHRKIYSIVLFGHLCDGFDINVMGFVLPSIIAAFHLTGPSAGFLASGVFFGMFVGAAGGGFLADRIGRKKTIIISLVLFGLASFLAATAPDYWTLWSARILEGLGLGAEVILIFSYVVEFLPIKTRGTLTSSTVFFWQISSLLAAMVAIWVVPHYGWRWMFAIGGIFALVSALAWLALPESIRFLIDKGRMEEAESIARRFGAVPVKHAAAVAPASQSKAGSFTLLSGAYLAPTLSVWSMQFLSGFVFFGIAVWLPTLLLHMGFSFVHSLLFTGIITGAGAVGNVVGGFCLDYWGRRPTIIAYFFLGGVALVAWGFSSSVASVVSVGAIGAFFSFGTAGPLFTYVSELYPTALRASGVGVSGSWQRVGGIVAPYILGVLVGAHVDVLFIFAFVGVLLLVGGVIACLTVIETKLESLEQIEADVVAAPVVESGARPYNASTPG